MNTPGIEVKPIITIDGDHEVNSVFFTDVKVPADQLIGANIFSSLCPLRSLTALFNIERYILRPMASI